MTVSFVALALVTKTRATAIATRAFMFLLLGGDWRELHYSKAGIVGVTGVSPPVPAYP
jgi:hypothetical protein